MWFNFFEVDIIKYEWGMKRFFNFIGNGYVFSFGRVEGYKLFFRLVVNFFKIRVK